MAYVFSALTAVLLTLFFHIYMRKTGYLAMTDAPVSGEEKTEILNENIPGENMGGTAGEKLPFYGKKQSVILTAVFFLLCVLINYPVFIYCYEMNDINPAAQPMLFFKMAAAHTVCACSGLTDLKRGKIHNSIITAGLIARAVLYIPEFFLARENFTEILKNDGLGFVIGFVMLFVVAVITKGGIGFGDVKLFGVLGLLMGSGGVFTVLFLSLVFSCICSVILMIAKKKTIKSSLPMAPFIYLGFAAVSVLGVF